VIVPSKTGQGRWCCESNTPDALLYAPGELGWFDDQHVAAERVQQGLGGVAEKESLQSRAGHGAHYYDIAVSLARRLLYGVDWVPTNQMTLCLGNVRGADQPQKAAPGRALCVSDQLVDCRLAE
jgi:hypothetical protein